MGFDEGFISRSDFNWRAGELKTHQIASVAASNEFKAT